MYGVHVGKTNIFALKKSTFQSVDFSIISWQEWADTVQTFEGFESVKDGNDDTQIIQEFLASDIEELDSEC